MRRPQPLIQIQNVRPILGSGRRDIDPAADSDNDVPIPEKIPAPIYAVIRRKRALFGGLSRTEPSGSSSGIDAIDVDEDVAID